MTSCKILTLVESWGLEFILASKLEARVYSNPQYTLAITSILEGFDVEKFEF